MPGVIVYQLRCALGHEWEGWFPGMEDFERQQKAGRVVCPVCDVPDVRRVPSGTPVTHAAPVAPAPPPAASAQAMSVPAPQHVRAAFVHALHRYAREHCEDVGPAFATEARKIHEGGAPERGIRGTTTSEEEDALERDEIPFVKLPALPEQDS